MLTQIIAGTALIVFNVVLASILVAFGVDYLSRRLSVMFHNNRTRLTITLTLVTVWLVLVFTIVMWVWALAFVALNIFESFETALYFSMVSFTTLGFGDVILPDNWRLLSGFIATNGFILFGLGTAFMLETLKEESEQIEKQDSANLPGRRKTNWTQRR